jgi:parallel beta-helix repeat protein
MKLLNFIIAILILSGLYSNGFAAEYFLSPTGVDDNNRDGSQSQPWRTLNWTANNKLTSSDTLTCLPGDYGKAYMQDAKFDINSKVLIRSSELHVAIIGLNWVAYCSGIIFEDFDFGPSPGTDINVLQLDQSDHIIVRNCVIHDGPDGGDLLKINHEAHDIIIEGCVLYNPGSRYREGSWGGYKTETYQENIDIYDAYNIIVRKCWIYHIGNRGDHIAYVKGTGYNILFEENVIGPQSTSAHEGALSAGSVSTGVNAEGFAALNVTMRNNVIIDCGYAGIGVYAAKNTTIVGNILYNCGFRENPEPPEHEPPAPYITPPSPIIFRKTLGGRLPGQTTEQVFKLASSTRIDSNIIFGLGDMGAVVTKPEEDMTIDSLFHQGNTYWNSEQPISSAGVYDPNVETNAIYIDPGFPNARSVNVETDSYETIWAMFHAPTFVAQTSVEKIPQKFTLLANYPNPFNSSTVISYLINRTEFTDAKLTVYNVLGKIIREYINISTEAGTHKIFWDGKDSNGMQVSSGVYFYSLKIGSQYATNRMMLIK